VRLPRALAGRFPTGSSVVGKCNAKGCTSPHLTLYRDLPSMGFDNLATNGETQAGTTELAGFRRLSAIETIEYMGQVPRFDPGTRVSHGENHIPMGLREVHCDSATGIGIFQCVVDQDKQELS
jgi:hypothetical protein